MRWSELTAGLWCLSILTRPCVEYGVCHEDAPAAVAADSFRPVYGRPNRRRRTFTGAPVKVLMTPDWRASQLTRRSWMSAIISPPLRSNPGIPIRSNLAARIPCHENGRAVA